MSVLQSSNITQYIVAFNNTQTHTHFLNRHTLKLGLCIITNTSSRRGVRKKEKKKKKNR